jgi:SdrD B-like domain
MKRNFLPLLVLAAFSGAVGSLSAQDNVHPLTLVDQAGTARPMVFEAVLNRNIAHYDEESAYLALDPSTPSGSYYVHVTDQLNAIGDQVLSLNDPFDRYVTVTNMGGGVILLSVPNNPTLMMGAGLNGLGDSLPLGYFGENLENECLYKAWLGDTWDEPVNPDNPYLLRQGGVRSFSYFRIGNGLGSTISGLVFDDLDGNGDQDLGEPGLADVEVQLIGLNGTSSTLSTTDGSYAFFGVGHGDYEIRQIVDPLSGRVATTPTSAFVTVCGCGLAAGDDFGQNQGTMDCDGHTIGFWRNKHGLKLVHHHNLLPELGSLNVVDASGHYFTTTSHRKYKRWLKKANAVNMAYMLSAQLTAMHFNVSVGFVDGNCLIDDPNLGQVSIGSVINAAIDSLATDPYTPAGHAERAYQEQLKNALDHANNNTNWL